MKLHMWAQLVEKGVISKYDSSFSSFKQFSDKELCDSLRVSERSWIFFLYVVYILSSSFVEHFDTSASTF